MAKIFYQLRQNKNTKSNIYGRWFAHSKTIETLNTRKLAQHISEHGSIYTPDVVFGVLEKFRSCLLEMLLNSKRVKIDGLGIFYTTIENEKGGASSINEFGANNLKALHIRFLPEQEQEQNISSREFIKKAKFVNLDSLKAKAEDEEEGGANNNG
jgi:predicted histone-like DNA-binding protein